MKKVLMGCLMAAVVFGFGMPGSATAELLQGIVNAAETGDTSVLDARDQCQARPEAENLNHFDVLKDEALQNEQYDRADHFSHMKGLIAEFGSPAGCPSLGGSDVCPGSKCLCSNRNRC